MKRKYILLVLLLLAGLFYWFQVRPSIIRKRCVSDAEWNAKKINGWDGHYLKETYDFFYQRCLNKEGLK